MANQNFGELSKQLMAAAPQISSAAASVVVSRLIDTGIDGYSKFPSARKAAASALERSGGNTEAAIDYLIKQHLAMAGAQGFVTNLGGLLTMVVTMPANVTGVTIVQVHLVAAIAHLRGYDVDDARVRAAVGMILMGNKEVDELVASGVLPSPLIVATAPVIDPQLHARISERILSSSVASNTGKKMTVLATKRIPVVGGVVGAGADGWATNSIAKYARAQFVSRKR